MDLSNLHGAAGSAHSDNFRRGRGHGSGNGKTAGKGHKGQKARSGAPRPGLNVAYNYNPYQQIQFQVLNSRNGPSEEMYGDLERTKLPLVYTLNWNGNFLDVFKTRWSASVMNETKGEKMYYYALGNEFNFSPKWHAYFDWKLVR